LPLEADLFGCDHCQAGRHLVTEWNLPSEFEPIASDHHAPCSVANLWSMSELIKISCCLADAAGFAAFPGCEIVPFSELQDKLPSRERKAFHANLESLVQDVTDKINTLESL
jgi:hypothetical protein